MRGRKSRHSASVPVVACRFVHADATASASGRRSRAEPSSHASISGWSNQLKIMRLRWPQRGVS